MIWAIRSVISFSIEAGSPIAAAISSVASAQLGTLEAQEVLAGDLEDAEHRRQGFDMLITNGHGQALARRHSKAFLLRGFPAWERLGNGLVDDVLYEGGSHLLLAAANMAAQWWHEQEQWEGLKPASGSFG